MPRHRFIRVIYFGLVVAPIRFLGYLWAYFQCNTLGQGKNVYVNGAEFASESVRDSRSDWGRALGPCLSSLLNVVTWILTYYKRPGWLIPAGLVGLGLAIVVTYRLPEWAVFQ